MACNSCGAKKRALKASKQSTTEAIKNLKTSRASSTKKETFYMGNVKFVKGG